MIVEELIKLGSHKVRGSSDLMTIYINLFTKEFGKAPNCVGCSFSSDWQKLVNRSKSDQKQIIMTENKYKLNRIENRILTYKLNGIPYRIYDYLLTDHFAKEFLTHGTKEELKERKLLFKAIPENENDVSKIEVQTEDVKNVAIEDDKSINEIENGNQATTFIPEEKPQVVKNRPASKKRKRK